MKSLTKLSIASALVLALAVPAAQANHLPAFTGHTDLVSGGTWSGTNNFAVADLSGYSAPVLATLNAAWLGVGVLPSTGFLYLYQPTNDAGSSVALSQFTNSIGALGVAAPTVYGHFGSAINLFDGAAVTAANEMDDGAGSHITTAGPFVHTAPTSVTINLATRSIIASYSALAPGATSSVIAFVSSAPPGWFSGSLQNGGAAVGGRSPAPAPAPAAALLGVLGLGLVGVARKFRLG
jgi:hypothetical protein